MDWNYICYYQTGKNNAFVNLLELLNDAQSRGYLESSWYLHDIEAGFEICSEGEGLSVTAFSASVSNKTPSSTQTEAETISESQTSIKSTMSTPTFWSSVIFGVVFIGLMIILRKLTKE